MKTHLALLMAPLLAGAALADGEPLAVTASDFQYALDSVSPVAVKAAADMPATLWRASDDAVEVVAPDGTSDTISGDTWSPTAGGLWTLHRKGQGLAEDTALFTARHGLFGTQGAGTAASPAKIVDADELVDLNAGGGYVFALEGFDGLLGALRLPPSTQLDAAGGGLWRLVTLPAGCLYLGPAIAYSIDSKLPGPNRTAQTRETLRFAYTGDNWSRTTAAASTLTFVSPSGVTSVRNLAGTSVESTRLREPGLWHVTLAYAGTTLVSEINVIADATTLLLR